MNEHQRLIALLQSQAEMRFPRHQNAESGGEDVGKLGPDINIQFLRIDVDLVSALTDRGNAAFDRRGMDQRHTKKILGGNGRLAKTVKKLIGYVLKVFLGSNERDLFIERHALSGIGHVAVGEEGIKIEGDGAFHLGLGILALFLQDRLIE